MSARTKKTTSEAGVKRTRKSTAAPKRGRTAYIFFTSDIRPQIIKERPNASFAEISKMMSDRWKVVSPQQRKKYEDMAAKDKVRYEREMANYVPDPAAEKKKKRVRDPDAPKKALSGYNFFVKDNLSKMKSTGNMKDAVSSLAAQWKKMSDRERQPYLAAAQKDKGRYERERAKYDAK